MPTPQTVHAELAAAWNARDFERLRSYMHSEYTYTGPDGKELSGVEAGIAAARLYADAFPDGTLTVDRVTASGAVAAGEMTGRGTHNGDLMGIAPTGKRVSIPICNVIEIRDGRIYREREYFDMASMLAQLGVSAPASRTAGA